MQNAAPLFKRAKGCTGMALQHKDWPLWAFQLMALWSGVGGGNFASSMSNISTFFPKRLQGTALGLNAGLGNFGVTTMQIVIPLVMTMSIFGGLGSAVAEVLGGGLPLPLEILGIKDVFGESGAYEAILSKHGLDKTAVAEAAQKVIVRKK